MSKYTCYWFLPYSCQIQYYSEYIICYTYLGNEMDPSPYLLILWHDVLVLALNIADTDM